MAYWPDYGPEKNSPDSDGAAIVTTENDILKVDIIENVEPLDDQFGVHPPKTVPDALYDVMFGQPTLVKSDEGKVSAFQHTTPPLQTYAVLDAAKIIHLPELLETSGLEYRCLFKGAAYEELKSVAPWIVRLEEGNKFTRNLFTRGKAPWYLWDKEPGIYVRAQTDLAALWQHFRKFTKVTDANGKFYYFAFWTPSIWHSLNTGRANELQRKLLSKSQMAIIHLDLPVFGSRHLIASFSTPRSYQ